MPVDYSKFETIVDSDDEKSETPKVTKTASGSKQGKESFKKCSGCGKTPDGTKLKACTACKKVAYCSAQCQRSDWKFHKRTCVAAGGKPSSASSSSSSPRPRKPKPIRPREDESDDDDDDEPLNWYRHRETKLPPSASGPSKLETPTEPPKEQPTKEPDNASSASRASAWNAAGTWEERDVFKTVEEKVVDAILPIRREFSGGTVETKKVECGGDASIGVIRGTPRRIMDLSVTIKADVTLAGNNKN